MYDCVSDWETHCTIFTATYSTSPESTAKRRGCCNNESYDYYCIILILRVPLFSLCKQVYFADRIVAGGQSPMADRSKVSSDQLRSCKVSAGVVTYSTPLVFHGGTWGRQWPPACQNNSVRLQILFLNKYSFVCSVYCTFVLVIYECLYTYFIFSSNCILPILYAYIYIYIYMHPKILLLLLIWSILSLLLLILLSC